MFVLGILAFLLKSKRSKTRLNSVVRYRVFLLVPIIDLSHPQHRHTWCDQVPQYQLKKSQALIVIDTIGTYGIVG